MVAIAGTGVQLPEGEDPDAWAPAFDFAGLEPNSPWAEPQIRVEVTAEGWILRASDGKGTVRTAKVDTPHTARDREQVALVAGGLIRALAAASAPPSTATTLPPPPPPPALPPPKALPAPRVLPPPKTRAISEPAPALAPERVSDPVSRPVANAAPERSTAQIRAEHPPSYRQDLDAADKKRRGDHRNRVTMAPLDFGGGISTRGGTAAAGIATLGTRVFRQGAWSVDINVSITTEHWIYIDGARPVFRSTDVDMIGKRRFGRFLSLGALAGLSYRTFLQDGAFLDDATLPKVGGVCSLTLVGGRWWGIRSVTKASMDLGWVDLRPATGRRGLLVPLGVQSSIAFVFGNRVDPFLKSKTSRK